MKRPGWLSLLFFTAMLARTSPIEAQTIELVQHTSWDAGTASSATLAFNSNNTAGNWIGVCIRSGAANETFTVTDSKGNTYHKAIQFNQTGDGDTAGIFYAENIAGGANTIQVTQTISGTLRFAILEYSGVVTSGSLDVAAAAQGNSSSPNSGNAVTTANGDLLLGAIMTSDVETYTAGSGYNIEERVPAVPNTKLIAEDQIQGNSGTTSVSASLGAADLWAGGLAAFKAASSGSGTAPSITNVNPTSGAVGTSVTVTGTNFGATGTVTFNGVTATPTNWSGASITVPVPSGATTGNVVVTVGGVASNGVSFSVTSGIGIALVQHTSLDAGTSSTATLAFNANNTAGNWIGVCIRSGAVNETFTVTDSKGNTYHKAIQVNQTGDGDTAGIFYAENIAGGANTIQVSQTISATLRFAILEYSGVATSGSLDVAAAAQGNSSSPNSGNAVTTANGDLLLGAIMTSDVETYTAGSGYNIEERVPAVPNTKLIAEDQIQGNSGTTSVSASLGAADLWAGGLAAFKAVSSGSGTAPSITNVNPSSGAVGTSVTITGTNFGATQGTSTVKFNGTAGTPTSWSATSIVVPVPSGATTGNVIVTVGGV